MGRLLALAAWISSCAPQMRHRVILAPAEPDVQWDQGQPVVAREHGKIRLEMGVGQEQREKILFHLALRGEGADRLDLDPRSFLIRYWRRDSASRWLDQGRFPALDALAEGTAAESRVRELRSALNPFHPDAWGSDPCPPLLPPGRKPTSSELQVCKERREAAKERKKAEAEWKRTQAAKIKQAEKERDWWSHVALKKTTLVGWKNAEGMLAFPVLWGADRVEVEVPLATDTLRFPFVQRNL